jgi:hypothetical protein
MRARSFLAVALLAILLGAVFWLYVIPRVDYYLVPYYYRRSGDDWVTWTYDGTISTSNRCVIPVISKNLGAVPMTLEMVISFTGAKCLMDKTAGYIWINDTAAKLVFSLLSFQQKSINVFFNITGQSNADNVRFFRVLLTLVSIPSIVQVVSPSRSLFMPSDYSYRELYFGEGLNDNFAPTQIS